MIKTGIELALGGRVPEGFLAHLTDTAEEAALRSYHANARRTAASEMAKYGFHLP